MYNGQVAPMLNNFFARHIPTDVLVKKDQLLLDLGILRDEELERELPVRLEKALEEFFRPFLHNHWTEWSAAHVEVKPASSGYLQMLEHLLLTGTLPWQVASPHTFTWQTLLDTVYQQEPDSLQQLLRRLGLQQSIRARLAYQSDEEDMQKIITTIEPGEAPVILAYKNNIEAVQREKQLVKSGSTEFSQALSLFILTYLLEEKESEFSRKSFLKSILMQMAAHYNIAYQDLIFVLLEAMPPVKTAVSTTDSLFNLVQELNKEVEGPFPAMFLGAGMQPATNGQLVAELSADNTQQQALLLTGKLYVVLYYLQHGSLPPEQGTFSKEELAGYLLELARAAPATVKDMIGSLPGKTLVSQRLTAMLAKKDVTNIISLWLPQDALFIERWIVLLQQLPAENGSGAHVDAHETLVYTNVLDAMFTGASQAFDRQGFVRLSMQLLSQQYRVAVPALAEALIAVTRSDHKSGSPYAAHTAMLANLAAVHETHGTDIAPAGNVYHVSSTDEHVGQQALTDVLVYFLQFGALPWWSGQYTGQSPETLLEIVYERSRQDAIRLLMKAGMQERMKRRWLQFPDSLTEKICSHLPGWNRAQEALAAVMQLMKALPFLKPAAVPSFRYIALDTVWTSYTGKQYRDFDEIYFYKTVLARLVVIDEQTLPALQEAVRNIRTQHVSGEDALILQLLHDMQVPDTRDDDRSINILPGQEEKIDSNILSAEGYVETTVDAYALQEVVQQLLQQDSLPDPIRQLLLTYGGRFIEQLQELPAAELVILLHLLAKHVVTGHAPLAALIGQVSRRALLRHQLAGNPASHYSPFIRLEQAMNQLVPAAAGTDASTGIGAESYGYRNIDDLIRQYAGIPEPAGMPVVNRLRLVENLLDYYLTWNRLPDGLPAISGRAADEQLEDLLLLLYQENADGLKRLFSNEKHTATARMRLHNLFARKGGRHRKIAVWLESYWERDAVRYLKEMAINGNSDEQELKPLLDKVLKKAKSNKKQIAGLLQLPTMAGYIACHYDEETLRGLIRNSSGADQEVSGQSLAVISLLVNSTPDPAGKARLRLLLYEFTLGYFSGTTAVRNIREYIQTLFMYLSRSGTASTAFLAGLFHNTAAGKGVVAMQRELLPHTRQALLQQLHIQQQHEAVKVQLEEQRRIEAAAATAVLQKQLQGELEQKQQEEARRKRSSFLPSKSTSCMWPMPVWYCCIPS